MPFNISMNSTTNETILDLAKRALKEKQYRTNNSLFFCLFIVLGVLLVGTGIAENISVLLIIKRTQTLQTAQNYLLANLASADITSLLFCCFPLNNGSCRWRRWNSSLYIICQLQRSSHLDSFLRLHTYSFSNRAL